ncbi:hypothetical protein AN958_03762 [Leucoagaricus sp. SymC.cos]|nr:hypothetical protein AN958_03762 [Leucoagaricus sp. SymC.cos]
MGADDDFRSLRIRIRNEDLALKDRSNLFQESASVCISLGFLEVWYQNGFYVKIHDIPGTLSGKILRLRANVPPLEGHTEIKGNNVTDIAYKEIPLLEDWDDQDAREAVSQLPVVAFDPKIHFPKVCRCVNEVPNLLRVKGHPHIVSLLGRSEAGELVFPRYQQPFLNGSISDYRRLLLQLADAVIFLHLLGIVHRDLAFRNLLLSDDGQDLILCDLECRYGSFDCPEIALARDNGDREQEWPYSEKSDVWCFGVTIATFVLQNNPRTPWQHTDNFVPPVPFDWIFHACLRSNPDDRPSMVEVKGMLESIRYVDCYIMTNER